jgi:hypothetical protein
MPGARLPMRKIRDVLRLSAAGLSKRKIAVSLGNKRDGRRGLSPAGARLLDELRPSKAAAAKPAAAKPGAASS